MASLVTHDLNPENAMAASRIFTSIIFCISAVAVDAGTAPAIVVG
jgi:hypothetical protein